jgi:uncharacterized cupredoxin-like copper-binding protein
MPVIEQEKPTVIEKETTEARTPTRPVPSPASKRLPAIVLAAALLAVALIVTGIVLAAGGSETSATNAPAPAPAATPVAAPAPAAVAASIGVTLKEFTVFPAPSAGRAGRLTFRVRNAGAVGHEFVVLRTSKSAAGLLQGGRASEAGNVGEIGDLQPGVTKTLRLNLKPGHYALICNLPGHYAAGQRADFVVK